MEPQHSANATPTNRWVNRVSCAGRSTPGLAFTVDPTISSGWLSWIAVAYCVSQAFVLSRHVFDWPALPTGGRPTRPSWVSRFTQYEDGLGLGYGRESHERPEGAISTSGLGLPRHLVDLIDSRGESLDLVTDDSTRGRAAMAVVARNLFTLHNARCINRQ